MTAKTRRAATAKGKPAAGAKAKPATKPQEKDVVVEVSNDQKAVDVDHEDQSNDELAPKAPAPDHASAAQDESAANGSAANTDDSESDPDSKAEKQAEKVAEQAAKEAQKPFRRESSQASMADSVTVSPNNLQAADLLELLIKTASCHRHSRSHLTMPQLCCEVQAGRNCH